MDVHGRKGPSKIAKKPARQATLQDRQPEIMHDPAGQDEQLAPHEMKLEPIMDKRSYDHFIRAISLRIYIEFERTICGEGGARPEVALAGFDLRNIDRPEDVRMADYVALNARLIVERAFTDLQGYVARYMPRIAREVETHGGSLAQHVESKVQRDIVMEIRAIAIQHMPEGDRYSYRHKLKDL
jgi:hypothetical protein